MTTANGTARSGLLAAGIVVLIVGVVTAAGLWYSAGQRYDDAVRGLARAPIGCDTTLDFAAAGSFLVFVETTGSMTDIPGDCTAATEYSSTTTSPPSVQLSMIDPDGNEVVFTDTSGTTYDTAGFVGESIRSVGVVTAGDHVLRVESSSIDVALAVGRDPNNGVGALKLGAAIAAIAGLVGGGVLLVLSTRRRDVPVVAAPVWTASAAQGWPTAPPGMPQPPAPAGWQPAVGPPSQVPGPPAAHPAQPAPQHGTSPAPSPARPPAVAPWQPQGPSGQSPVPTNEDFGGSDAGTRSGGNRSDGNRSDGNWSDGSSGDGERSPWAPPEGDAR